MCFSFQSSQQLTIPAHLSIQTAEQSLLCWAQLIKSSQYAPKEGTVLTFAGWGGLGFSRAGRSGSNQVCVCPKSLKICHIAVVRGRKVVGGEFEKFMET